MSLHVPNVEGAVHEGKLRQYSHSCLKRISLVIEAMTWAKIHGKSVVEVGIEPKSWATASTVQSAQGSGAEIWKCFIYPGTYLLLP